MRTWLSLSMYVGSLWLYLHDLRLRYYILQAAVFSSVGTAGQRCTTLRRLIIHSDVYDEFTTRLVSALKNVKIGDPLETDTLCGPLHNPGLKSVTPLVWCN